MKCFVCKIQYTILVLAFFFLVFPFSLFANPIKGKVRVKVCPDMLSELEHIIATGSSEPGKQGRFAQQFSTYLKGEKPKRVYQDAGLFEAKHQEYGLHLWYEFSIGDTNPIVAAEEMMKLSEYVLAAEPIYSLVHVEPVFAQYSESELSDKILKDTDAVSTFNDPYFIHQWALCNTGGANGTKGADIRLLEAIDLGLVNPSSHVVVAVIDDGVDYNHPDLKQNMWVNQGEIAGNGIDDDQNRYVDDVYGYNFVDNTATIVPSDHGTHVAGVIAAVNNNGVGISSIAGGTTSKPGVRIMNCQIFKGKTSASAADALVYAADNGAVIAQNSWGYNKQGYFSEADKDAIRYFISEAGKDKDGVPRPNTPMVGGIVIFAAGNDTSSELWYPAAYDSVVAVAAVGSTGKLAYYSNYGDWVDITAPGGSRLNNQQGIFSTVATANSSFGKYDFKQGTSMACPHVSAVAALILSEYGGSDFTPDKLRMRLEASARSLEEYEPTRASLMGFGMLDVASALAPATIPLSNAYLPSGNFQLYVGEVKKMKPIFEPSDAFDKRMVWETGNADIFQVDKLGYIKATGVGTAKLTAKSVDGRFSSTCLVTVDEMPTGYIELNAAEIVISVEETFRLVASLHPANSSKTVSFESSNSEVATVDGKGIVKAVSVGSATITVAGSGVVPASCGVVVLPKTEGLEVSHQTLKLMVNETKQLNATVAPKEALYQSVKWSSSSPELVEVNTTTGLVKARKPTVHNTPPYATILATSEDGQYTANTLVTVYDRPEVPEGFSPNNDGVNDYFEIFMGSQASYSLQVFDIAGQLCYEHGAYDNSWNGVANRGARSGKKVLPGTYFYVLNSLLTNDVVRGYVVVKY